MSRTVQIPAFRHTVAEQMAGNRERIAERIRVELARRGEQPADLAYRIKVHTRTVENWVTPNPENATRPQGANLRKVADDFNIPIEELDPDLELLEKAFRDQLQRIEDNLNLVLDAMGISPSGAAEAAEEADRATSKQQGSSAGTQGASRKKRTQGG